MRLPGINNEEKPLKRKSIGRIVNMGNGHERIGEIAERMSKEEDFKKVLIYDNISDESFLNNYFLGTIFSDNKRLFYSMSVSNPNRKKLAESFDRYMKYAKEKYARDIDRIIHSHLSGLADGEAVVMGDIANNIFSTVRVDKEEDFMLIAFIVGSYLSDIAYENSHKR